MTTRRAIRLGAQSLSRVEVLDGLKPGERVVVSGAELFKGAEEDVAIRKNDASFQVKLAKSGKLLDIPADKTILDVLKERYPDVKTAISMGYWFTTAPQYYKGVIYIGSTRSESHIPGGHVLAIDAKTGKVLWRFNTVPADGEEGAEAVAHVSGAVLAPGRCGRVTAVTSSVRSVPSMRRARPPRPRTVAICRSARSAAVAAARWARSPSPSPTGSSPPSPMPRWRRA